MVYTAKVHTAVYNATIKILNISQLNWVAYAYNGAKPRYYLSISIQITETGRIKAKEDGIFYFWT